MEDGIRKLALLVEYDGSAFHGFQAQSNAATVQGALEEALGRLTGERVRIQGASRTDAGVHAAGQVASFVTTKGFGPATFVAALNYYLPQQVAVRAAREVAPGFDPRRDAVSRSYRYVILDQSSPSPLARAYSLWVRSGLDVAAMQQGARHLIGRYDLASFSGPLSRRSNSTVRRVYRAELQQDGPLVCFRMEANAFLPQQARRTVGVLLAIGRGRKDPEFMRTLRDHPKIGMAETVAPAHALCLTGITYPHGNLAFPIPGEPARSCWPGGLRWTE